MTEGRDHDASQGAPAGAREPHRSASLELTALNHVGIRVAERERSLAFYRKLGFEEVAWYAAPRVAILRNTVGLELNLIVNANDANGGRNVLMDVDPVKYAGYTHAAFRVASASATAASLTELGIPISEGPVNLGGKYLALFVRDPDGNVIELGEVLG